MTSIRFGYREKECVGSLQNTGSRKRSSGIYSRGVFPYWNRMQGRRRLFAGTEGVRREAPRRGRSWVLVYDYRSQINGAFLIAQLHAGRRSFLLCLRASLWSRLLPRASRWKLGGGIEQYPQRGHQYVWVQRLERIGLAGRWRWGGEAFTFECIECQ